MLLIGLLEVSLSIDIWHDTAFQFVVIAVVTLLAAVITSFISFWIFRKQRNRKEISYEVVSNAPIASINKEVKDKVEILYEGKPVKDLSLLVLKVWNSGNVAVKPEDFIEPIKFKFEGRTIISRDLLDTEPKDLIDPMDIGKFLTSRLEPE